MPLSFDLGALSHLSKDAPNAIAETWKYTVPIANPMLNRPNHACNRSVDSHKVDLVCAYMFAFLTGTASSPYLAVIG